MKMVYAFVCKTIKCFSRPCYSRQFLYLKWIYAVFPMRTMQTIYSMYMRGPLKWYRSEPRSWLASTRTLFSEHQAPPPDKRNWPKSCVNSWEVQQRPRPRKMACWGGGGGSFPRLSPLRAITGAIEISRYDALSEVALTRPRGREGKIKRSRLVGFECTYHDACGSDVSVAIRHRNVYSLPQLQLNLRVRQLPPSPPSLLLFLLLPLVKDKLQRLPRRWLICKDVITPRMPHANS